MWHDLRTVLTVASLLLMSLSTPRGDALARPASPSAAPPPCDCTHLPALQAELRNAQRLQAAFRGKIAELRTMNGPTSLTELQRWAATDARRGLEEVPGYRGPSEVDYESWGQQNITIARGNPNDRLCGMTPQSQQQLAAAEAGSACDGIGRALRAHEEHHMQSCRRIGFFPYIAVHGADRAQEEVEAYGAQIAVLRAEIARVLENSDVRVVLELQSRTEMPRNPLYTALIVAHRGQMTTTRSSVSGSTARFDVRGEQVITGSIEGNCHWTAGLPMTVPVSGTVETDGLTATVRYRQEGQTPPIGMQCKVPGGPSGSGFSMPVSLGNSELGPPVTLPLKDGAEVEYDLATSQAARLTAGSGVRITGTGKIRLECKRRR